MKLISAMGSVTSSRMDSKKGTDVGHEKKKIYRTKLKTISHRGLETENRMCSKVERRRRKVVKVSSYDIFCSHGIHSIKANPISEERW